MRKYNIVGVMSGTSMDGLDIAHVSLTEQEDGKWQYSINEATTIEYGEKWRLRLSKLRHQNAMIFHKTDRFYGQFIGENIKQFLEDNNLEADLVSSHGHTVFHQPENNITVQIGDGNSITAITGLPVVTNFRAIDVILGGEGAPLVGIADQLLFGEYDMCLNLGGFANISGNVDGQRIAYDVSPCNIILNRIAREFDQEYDKDGEIVYSGKNVSMGYTSSFKDLKSDDNKNRILKTGDIGTKDEDGYFYITGRKIRDVKVYGHRVNLDEIEKILEKKSLKCFCIGSTDLIKIFYSNQNYKSSEIINFISNSTNINKKSFKTIFIEKIPVNQNGKISYNQLRTL